MAELDYTKLSKPQRLAVFLIVVGPETTSDLLGQFDDNEVELICREMGKIPVVPEATRAAALAEFGPIIGSSLQLTLGGPAYARQTLSMARGEYKAEAMMSRFGAEPTVTSSELMEGLAEMDGRQIYNLLKSEQPQTIAYLLSHLGPAKSGEVFQLLPGDIRDEVVERLGTIENTPRDLVSKIVRSLNRHLDGKVSPSYLASGGVRAVADLLNTLDKESSKELLSSIEERNATLGAAVRRKMFSFEDIRRLESSDLQLVLREVDSSNLAVAMKSATDALRTSILGAVSKRAAEALEDEISMLGPVRLRDVEAAQDGIIQVVRRLEEEGTIALDGAESSMVA
jgi:flagellar motor switch protein FliG